MKKIHKSLLRVALSAAGILALSVNCAPPPQVHRFADCQELESFLQDQIIQAQNQPQPMQAPLMGCSGTPMAEQERSADMNDGAQSTSESNTANDFTTTNTQELNVDEADFVKNDGEHIFVLRRGHLTILDAWPADQTHIVADLDLDAGRDSEDSTTPFAMFFDQDRLLVISTFFGSGDWGGTFAGWRASTELRLYAVADQDSAPTLLRRVDIDGRYMDSRRIGDQVVVITSSQLNWPEFSTAPFSESENRARIDEYGIAGLLPRMRDEVIGQGEATEDSACSCENTFAPDDTDGRSLILVHSLSLRDETQAIHSTTVVSPWSQVYGSEKSIYLASTAWDDGGFFTPEFATTRLHKFSLADDGRSVDYQATASIQGQIHNQFSMDEEGDDFRVVVSSDNDGRNNSLLVLSQDGDQLQEVGRVDDIGKGEFVQAVRFFSDRAFVVTYPEQSFQNWQDPSLVNVHDPLLAIDLSEAHAPKLSGELEIDGYSTYIHPIDRDHLLTIGVNTDTSNVIQGLSLSIFDVTDLGAPQLAHRENLGDSFTWSEALTDHHAFTYFPASKALGIPVQLADQGVGNAGEGFRLQSTGLEVYQVDVDTGFTHLGRVEQAPMFSSSSVDAATMACIDVRRSVMMSDDNGAYVYAISTGGVSVSEISTGLPAVASVPFLSADDNLCPAGNMPL